MALIENGATFKHKVFFTLLYSTGLRLGEALRLRVEDVQVATMQLRVLDGGKGIKTDLRYYQQRRWIYCAFIFEHIDPKVGYYLMVGQKAINGQNMALNIR